MALLCPQRLLLDCEPIYGMEHSIESCYKTTRLAVFMVFSIFVLMPESRASATRPVRATSRIPYGCSKAWMADILLSLPCKCYHRWLVNNPANLAIALMRSYLHVTWFTLCELTCTLLCWSEQIVSNKYIIARNSSTLETKSSVLLTHCEAMHGWIVGGYMPATPASWYPVTHRRCCHGRCERDLSAPSFQMRCTSPVLIVHGQRLLSQVVVKSCHEDMW